VSDNRHPGRNIVLTGFHLAGKTTVGRELARRMRRPLVDLPTEVERRQRSLLSPFTRRPSDNEAERRIVSDIASRREVIIATGADTLLREWNADELRVFSFLVFLDPPFEMLCRRAQSKRFSHPALGPFSLDEAFQPWQERRQAYEHCDLQLTDGASTPELTARLVLHCFYT